MNMYKISVPFGIKAANGNTIEGHGSTFGNVDLGFDVIMPGAFDASIKRHAEEGSMPAMLWQHQTDQIPGVWKTASEDDEGLALAGEFADTQLGRESRTLAKMRAFRGLSIGGTIPEDGFRFDRRGVRIIEEFDLWEVSLVTFPMNPQAQIEAVKSQFSTPRALERHLRDAGCSIKTAKTIVSDLLGSSEMEDPAQRDVDDEIAKGLAVLTERVIADQMRKLRQHHG